MNYFPEGPIKRWCLGLAAALAVCGLGYFGARTRWRRKRKRSRGR